MGSLYLIAPKEPGICFGDHFGDFPNEVVRPGRFPILYVTDVGETQSLSFF